MDIAPPRVRDMPGFLAVHQGRSARPGGNHLMFPEDCVRQKIVGTGPTFHHGGCSSMVRALGCGPRGCGFESHHSPHLSKCVASLVGEVDRQGFLAPLGLRCIRTKFSITPTSWSGFRLKLNSGFDVRLYGDGWCLRRPGAWRSRPLARFCHVQRGWSGKRRQRHGPPGFPPLRGQRRK